MKYHKIMIIIYFSLNLGLLLAVIPAVSLAQSPSFDCSKASVEVENLICADGQLANLDRQLAATYQAALSRYPETVQDNVKALQSGWIKKRNDCWETDDIRQCVADAYRLRITELQITSGQLIAPSPVYYECDGGRIQNLTVVYYRDAEMPAAVLTNNAGDQAIVYAQVAASGTHYQGPDLSFWIHGDEAQLNWLDAELICLLR